MSPILPPLTHSSELRLLYTESTTQDMIRKHLATLRTMPGNTASNTNSNKINFQEFLCTPQYIFICTFVLNHLALILRYAKYRKQRLRLLSQRATDRICV